MAIITSRTSENGRIQISYDRCNSCGLCVKVCKDFSLIMENNKPVVSDHPLFGCMACGHCMAICPTQAIEVSGREMSSADLIDLSEMKDKSSYEQLKNLMAGRRSIRDFKDMEIGEELMDLLYDAPLAMYFSASPYCDPADPYIPATYAMLAAESLGLGSCMIGSIHPFIQYGAKKLKRKWNLPAKSSSGIVVIFGYPKYKFTSGIKRTFAEVTYFAN